ncbi:type II secretion system secretin GspD [Coralloluteibacterium thermophilus]|uniref:Type II secretion system secretin GspD n=1 Tax=Coralloluteibacterium thermophilum TaxID=2707049 RepID=A0ABV9NKD6_9GAMM
MNAYRLPALLLFAAAFATAPSAPAQDAAGGTVLNLQNADVRAFIQDVARATGSTFIIDPRVQGTVTISSNEPLPPSELLAILVATLRANGLVAVPAGAGTYRIVPDDTAAQQPGVLGGEAGFRTEVFRLASIDARTAADTIKPLVGRGGVVVPTAAGNTLLVADYADNLRRVRDVLAQLDNDRAAVETVGLRNSSAREIAGVVNGMLGIREGGGTLTVIPVESSNAVILRGDAATVRRMAQVVADLDQRAEATGDVRVVRLQHANAEQLLPVLQQIVGQPQQPGAAQQAQGEAAEVVAPDPARRAVIARYPGANALIINAAPDTQRTLMEVIRQLDTRREQVLVEAIVVEVSDDIARRLGVQYAIGGDKGFSASNYSAGAPPILGLAGAAAANDIFPGDADAASALRQAALQSLAGTSGGLLGFGGRNGDTLFGVIINAVKSDTASNLLSTPSILTLDNEEARILVGQEVPLTTGEVLGDSNSNPFRTIQRQDVGIQLEVKPQINSGGGITLFLRQEVSAIAGPVSENYGELILNKREIETTVLVDDGDIVVLGGLLDQNERVSTDKVPGLGDIPGVGALFRSKGRQRNQTNLMVFIRPTIIRNAREALRETAPRYDWIRSQQRIDGVADLDALMRDYLRATPPAVPVGAEPLSLPDAPHDDAVPLSPVPEAR